MCIIPKLIFLGYPHQLNIQFAMISNPFDGWGIPEIFWLQRVDHKTRFRRAGRCIMRRKSCDAFLIISQAMLAERSIAGSLLHRFSGKNLPFLVYPTVSFDTLRHRQMATEKALRMIQRSFFSAAQRCSERRGKVKRREPGPNLARCETKVLRCGRLWRYAVLRIWYRHWSNLCSPKTDGPRFPHIQSIQTQYDKKVVSQHCPCPAKPGKRKPRQVTIGFMDRRNCWGIVVLYTFWKHMTEIDRARLLGS